MADAPSKNLQVSVLCLAGSGAVLVLTGMLVWSFPFALRYVALPSAVAQVALTLGATIAAFRHPVAHAGRSVLRFFCVAGLVMTGFELAIVALILSVLGGFSHGS
jgi:hypothetical protein